MRFTSTKFNWEIRAFFTFPRPPPPLFIRVCVVHACGLDSLPWDLGVLTAVQGSSQRFFPGVTAVSSYGALSISPSTGTVVSSLDAMGTTPPATVLYMIASVIGDRRDRLVGAKTLTKRLGTLVPRVPYYPHYSKEIGQWVFPVPFLIDSLVVRRSAQIMHKTEQSAPGFDSFSLFFSFFFFLLFFFWLSLTPLLLQKFSLWPVLGRGILLERAPYPPGHRHFCAPSLVAGQDPRLPPRCCQLHQGISG